MDPGLPPARGRASSVSSDCEEANSNSHHNRLAQQKEALLLIDPHIIRFTLTLLKVADKEQYSATVLMRKPFVHYCYLQCGLICKEFHYRLENSLLTHVDIREGLLILLQNFMLMARRCPLAFESFALYVERVVKALAEIEQKLSSATKIKAVEWTEALDAIRKKSQEILVESKSHEIPKPRIPSVSDFQVSGTIGHGGFGLVYKAVHVSSSTPMAIKVSPCGQALDKDLNKYTLMASVTDKIVASVMANAPLVVKTFACFVVQGRENEMIQLTLMELVAGTDLLKFIDLNGPLETERAWFVMAQLAKAIESFHFHGVIHKDIKPANIFLQPNGFIKIVDFDVSKICIEYQGRNALKSFFRRTSNEFRDRDRSGTEAYMAPELHAGQNFGRAVDWWAMGVTMFKCHTGKVPFRTKPVKNSVLQNEPPLLEFPASSRRTSAVALCGELLTKKAAKRLGSKSYRDIFFHAYFSDVEWRQLLEYDMPVNPIEFELQGKGSDIADFLADNVENPEKKQKIDIKFEDLKDCTDEQTQRPLLTYISSSMMTLMQEIEVEPEEVFENRCSFDLPMFGEITMESVTTHRDLAKIADIVEIMISKPSRWPLLRKSIKLELQDALDGTQRMIVRKISGGSIHGRGIYPGDIIVTINGVRMEDVPPELAEKLMFASEEPVVVLKVLADNPFRKMEEQVFDLNYELGRYGKKKLRCRSRKRKSTLRRWLKSTRNFGFTLSLRQCWLQETKLFLKIIIVDSANPEQQQLSDPNSILLMGDVVLSINGLKPTEINLTGMMDKSTLTIEFTPCSPLRCKLPIDNV